MVQQFDFYGRYQRGFWNSVLGQKDTYSTTEGYSYLAMNDDVYMYTGVTSLTNDESLTGFVLINQRTKEAKYYSTSGAKETSAQSSAEGLVQQYEYEASFPLLLNIDGEPTYFMSLKDSSKLVKGYAMINVGQYSIGATGNTLTSCIENYVAELAKNNIKVSVDTDNIKDDTNPEQKDITVTGKVTDQSGEPLIGATVLVTGTTNGASTNATGDYSIQVPEGASLTFQYIGYEAKTEKVGARTKVDVKLEQSKQTIDEVVVIGYGTVKKTDLTGSVANVKMSDIKDVPVVSVDQALQGRIAGADIMATTGEPGATTSIRIRGTRSISASNEPLIIVDGVIDGIHDLNDINSADIESISVLKDASSTAIYGARGSNGVIVITTKKGRGMDGRPNITFKTDLGFSQLPRQLDIMDATEFARYRNDYAYFFSSADGNDKIEPDSPMSKYPFPNPEAKGVGTNWIDTITRTALYQNYDLSISGASAKSSYYASAGFNETQGIIDNSGLKRYSARLKVDHEFAKWLKAGLNLSYTYRDQDENLATIGGTNWWNAAVFLSPFLSPTSDMNDLWYSGQKFNNPRIMLDHCLKNARRISLNNSAFVEVTPVKGLKLRSQFTYYSYQRHGRYYERKYGLLRIAPQERPQFRRAGRIHRADQVRQQPEHHRARLHARRTHLEQHGRGSRQAEHLDQHQPHGLDQDVGVRTSELQLQGALLRYVHGPLRRRLELRRQQEMGILPLGGPPLEHRQREVPAKSQVDRRTGPARQPRTHR